MTLITIIGRGHGGTRAMSHTLSASNVYMGEPLNVSGDLLPPWAMYDACRIMAPHIRWLGGLRWDFSALHTMPIPTEFTELIENYLATVLASEAEHKGWKIPETTLVFPWIVRLFPEIKYIYWLRNPRDNILARHLTDDLHDFGIDYPEPAEFLATHYPALQSEAATGDQAMGEQSAEEEPANDDLLMRLRRAISWQYQFEIIKATPKPKHWLTVRFEDFVLDQAATVARIEEYLGLPLTRIPVRPETVARYAAAEGVSYFPFLDEGMRAFGYEIPQT